MPPIDMILIWPSQQGNVEKISIQLYHPFKLILKGGDLVKGFLRKVLMKTILQRKASIISDLVLKRNV